MTSNTSSLVLPSASWGPTGQALPTLAGALQCPVTARSTSTGGSAYATGPSSLTPPGHPIGYLLLNMAGLLLRGGAHCCPPSTWGGLLVGHPV
jgi:hypothetical protein